MRVLVADDHDLLRDVLGSYLESEGGFEMHLACDVAGALKLIAATGPFDVTLLDFSMPGMNGYQGLKQVMAASEGRPVAIMSGTLPAGGVDRALEEGAAGFVPKTLPARSVVNAIRFMASGERYLPIDLMRGLGAAKAAQPFDSKLSPRESQVLRALCEGKANKEIALDLELREPTVKLHVKLVCRKLGARNRTHAAMIARDAGFF
jgi:DNA-binding NarL/FixJ family response regulator